MLKINSLLVKTDVTTVKIEDNFILVGIGDQLHIYEKNSYKQVLIVKVFEKERIFGIAYDENNARLLLHGVNKIKIYKIDLNRISTYEELKCYSYTDWILTAKWIDTGNKIATVSMHNTLLIWTPNLNLEKTYVCKEKCILYSAHLAYENFPELIVLSGTVFSEILIWWPYKFKGKDLCPILTRLKGHQGVIFSIDCNPSVGLICSTSDDRSARLWQAESLDLISELKEKTNTKIILKRSLYGHASRVFKCKILHDIVLTAGEDSLINIWDTEGNHIKKLETCDGNCLWTLDCDKDENMLVTGGCGCGVTAFSLKDKSSFQQISLNEKESPKNVCFMRSGNIAVVSEKAVLYYYNFKKESWICVKNHEDLKNYVLMEVSSCRRFLSLSGYYGDIHIYEEADEKLLHKYSHKMPDNGRIFSFHWLTCSIFLTCSKNGVLSLWKENGEFCLKSILKLPKSKERWTTAACLLNHKYLVIGDRKGTIYLYSLSYFDPLQIIKKAHNYLGITGRDGIVKSYIFDPSTTKLLTISSNKLPITWLAAVVQINNFTIILSFVGSSFFIYDYDKRRTIAEIKCGGGHRAWDCKIASEKFNFCYIKDKIIHCHTGIWSKSFEIMQHFHVKEINAAACILLGRCFFLVSGGEDTTLKISRGQFDDSTFDVLITLKSHLSSIRCIFAKEISNFDCIKSVETKQILLFSGGGRAQVIMWKLIVNKRNNEIICKEMQSYYEPLGSEESETRIMDLLFIDDILVAACSDGSLKMFHVSSDCMEFLCETLYKHKCVTKIACVKIFGHNLFAFALTSGEVVIFNFTVFLEQVDDLKVDKKVLKLIDPLVITKLHQSGINSLVFKVINDDGILVLSGGDDNAITVTLLKWHSDNQVKVVAKFCNNTIHCAQVTGLSLVDDYVFSVSVDQKFAMYRLTIKEQTVNLEFIKYVYTVVPDIQGMQLCKTDNELFVLLYGRGIQIIKIV